MKKLLVGAGALMGCSLALAQSNVTVFGIVDAAVEHVSNQGGPSVTRLMHSGSRATRLGFRGTEDLGAGMKAGFWLEGGLQVDNGGGIATNSNNQATGGPIAPNAPNTAFTFNRRATVSLSGAWGEVRMGRDYNPATWNLILDPFLNVGIAAAPTYTETIVGATVVRVSNSIQYYTPPKLGGFSANVAYWLGENLSTAANSKDGRGMGLRVAYTQDAYEVSYSASQTKYLAGDVKNQNIYGFWDLKTVRVMLGFNRDKNGTTSAHGGSVLFFIPVGSGEVKAMYSRYQTDPVAGAHPRFAKVALGYEHFLSKRTSLYGTVGRLLNKGGGAATVSYLAPAPAANGTSSGIGLGMRHIF